MATGGLCVVSIEIFQKEDGMIPSEKTLQIGRLEKMMLAFMGNISIIGDIISYTWRIYIYIYTIIYIHMYTHIICIYILYICTYNIINMYCLYTCIHDNPFQFGLSDVQIHVVSSLVSPLSMANDVNDTATLGPPRQPGNRHKNLHVVMLSTII